MRGSIGADATMEFKILGPPEVIIAGRQKVAVAPKLWCVLASLLMAPNISLSAEILIDHLWDDEPPAQARSTLRSYIWRIARLLSQASEKVVRISRQGQGYTLAIDPLTVDLHRFRSLRKQSDGLAESGETGQAVHLLREAEGIWRGSALAGVPGDWIGRMRVSLEEERRLATWRRVDLELVLGRHAELIAELSDLTQRYPMDTELARHWMTALYRAGRQVDALVAYRKIRARHEAEGLDLDPVLARLYEQVLRHDQELAVPPVHRRADREPADTVPSVPEDFVGRTEEIRLLTADPGEKKRPILRVIEGMGGAGKTVLAVQAARMVAERYQDARVYINLRAHDPAREALEPSEALADLLGMLGVPAKHIPGGLAARTELWRAELVGRRAVLVLDDVADPGQIGPLLPVTGDCLILVTSRRHADWKAERSLTLGVLPDKEAAELFTRTATGVATREPGQVARVVTLCGGLPLAIRLAAGRLRSSDAGDLEDLIGELEGLNSGYGNGSELGNRIQSAFEASYRQLTPGEQHCLHYLSVSPCFDISVESAAILSGNTPAAARAALDALVSHHLVEETSPGRFVFHDLVRVFATGRSARADPGPQRSRAVGMLADHYLGTVTRLSAALHGHVPEAGTPEEVTAWLEAEWRNVLRVAEYCARNESERRCADLVHALADFMETNSHWDAALTAHQMALNGCRDTDDLPGAGRAALDLSLVSLRTGRGDAALRYATDAASAFEILGDLGGKASALDRTGVVHRNSARFREALAHHQEAMEMFRAADDSRGVARALLHAGTALSELGRYAEGMSYFSEALDIFQGSADLRGQATTLNNIGALQYEQGLHRDAVRCFQASHEIFRKIGGRQNLALLDHNMGQIYQYKENHGAAMSLYRKVLADYRAIGDLRHQARVLVDIGSVYHARGKFHEALAHYERAAAMGGQVGDRYLRTKALCGIAGAHHASGRPEVALKRYRQAVGLAAEIESPFLKAIALEGMAETVHRLRGAATARIYLREAYDIFAQIGSPRAGFVEMKLDTFRSALL